MTAIPIPIIDQLNAINADCQAALASLMTLPHRPRHVANFWLQRLAQADADRGECECSDGDTANERAPSLDFSQT